jgi:hypothetical protein
MRKAMTTTKKPRLSGPMIALLLAAAGHPKGRAYNTGQRGFMATHAALLRRGYLIEVDDSAGVITDEGRAAVGLSLTPEQIAERTAEAERAEAARVERERLNKVARRGGWLPAPGDGVTLPDGTPAKVLGGARDTYHCHYCDSYHRFPGVVTARSSVLGVAECKLWPTRETARAFLLGRAAHLDRQIGLSVGYPANGRWAAEAAELRAAAESIALEVVNA